MIYPQNSTPLLAYEDLFGGAFFGMEPDGCLVYEKGDKVYSLRNYTEHDLLQLIAQATKSGKDLLMKCPIIKPNENRIL